MIDIADGHHSLSHHGNDAAALDKLRRINRFHIQQFAYLDAEAGRHPRRRRHRARQLRSFVSRRRPRRRQRPQPRQQPAHARRRSWRQDAEQRPASHLPARHADEQPLPLAAGPRPRPCPLPRRQHRPPPQGSRRRSGGRSRGPRARLGRARLCRAAPGSLRNRNQAGRIAPFICVRARCLVLEDPYVSFAATLSVLVTCLACGIAATAAQRIKSDPLAHLRGLRRSSKQEDLILLQQIENGTAELRYAAAPPPGARGDPGNSRDLHEPNAPPEQNAPLRVRAVGAATKRASLGEDAELILGTIG